jgi:hypothetical protein
VTLPNEELMALKNINDFLIDLCYIRKREDRIQMARKLLRHYPANWKIDECWKLGVLLEKKK